MEAPGEMLRAGLTEELKTSRKMVREVRFELTTSCSQSRRATGLRYTLTERAFYPIFAMIMVVGT